MRNVRGRELAQTAQMQTAPTSLSEIPSRKGGVGERALTPVPDPFDSTFRSEDLFQKPSVHRIQIEMTPEEIRSLRMNSRENVRGSLRIDDRAQAGVLIHLKGSKGSFRPLDDKPGFTIDIKRHGKFNFGMGRLHLNNSVEDPSYLNAILGTELFRKAGVPAPRMAWAVVSLNQRNLGLYVVQEGFTADFLRGNGETPTGGFLQPDTGRDIDGHLKASEIDDASEIRPQVKRLAMAAKQTDLDRRWRQLEMRLDVDRFITFAAMEILLSHRDGYCLARNNYRIWWNKEQKKFVFLPQGLDRLFGPVNLPLEPSMVGLVAQSLMETAEGKRRFRDRLNYLFRKFFDTNVLMAQIDSWASVIRPHLSQEEVSEFNSAVSELRVKIQERSRFILRALSEPVPQPLARVDGGAVVNSWLAHPPTSHLSREFDSQGRDVLVIAADPEVFSLWRANVVLPRGKYSFEGRMQSVGVKHLPFGKHHGAELRVVGHSESPMSILPDSDWDHARVDFEIADASESVELVCQLRARSGNARFKELMLKRISVPSAEENQPDDDQNRKHDR